MFGFTNTDWIAGYAALVSTLVVVWEVYKYYRSEKVRLTGYTTSNMLTFNVPGTDGKTYIVLKIHNRGAVPCTVTHVYLAAYKNKWTELRNEPDRIWWVPTSGTFGPQLPFRMEKGDQFSSAILQNEEIVEATNKYRAFMGIQHTMSEKPFLIRVKPIKVEKLD